jgi:hypothetical protein
MASSTGVIIVDNVLFYEGDLKLIAFSVGDTVTIRGYSGDTILVQRESGSGTLLKGVLIDLGQEVAEEQLFVFARGYYDAQAYAHAGRLFVHFLHFFSGSRFYAEALYYMGLAYEALARAGLIEAPISGIAMNEGTGDYYYTGVSYKHILEQFPDSPYAARAAYRLHLCLRAAHEPWDRAIDIISRDLEALEALLVTYHEFDERPAVLLEIGYVNRVLLELTGDVMYRTEAEETFNTVIDNYPSTVHEASARVHLYELAREIPIYLY